MIARIVVIYSPDYLIKGKSFRDLLTHDRVADVMSDQHTHNLHLSVKAEVSGLQHLGETVEDGVLWHVSLC